MEQATQAATLLLAKDRLNAVANPANGASIAFTLLVAGDDELTGDSSLDSGRRCRWLGHFLKVFCRIIKNPKRSPPPKEAADNSSTIPRPEEADSGPPSPPNGIWGGRPPSRISLARLAYPGLVVTAARFNWQIKAIIFLLFAWLIFTCVLSWNIAAGHAILVRLDGLQAAKTTILKKIADAETAAVKRVPGASVSGAASSTPLAAPTPVLPPATTTNQTIYTLRYCERPRLLSPAISATGGKIEQFDDVTELEICDDLAENQLNYNIGREDLADWLAAWRWLKGLSHLICRGSCLDVSDRAAGVTNNAPNEQQWAAVLLEVLATAVLPLCYGFLGAGAAVVRNIWGKMRDSLLSPRDLTLSLGQLALGAVIGACIGLFVTPSGPNAQGAIGLTGSITLTPSALSFIAGFGVEGVFVALESLIKRVFNIPDPKP